MKIKENRAASFLIVTLVYLLAGAVGILTYLVCDGHFAVRLLIADVAATVLTYIFSLIFKNASVYDPYWSVQPAVILVAYAISDGLNAFGFLLLCAVLLWAIRLTANWAYTFHGLSHQDWRYTMLANTCGKLYQPVNFIGIHLVPTLIVYACTLPAVYAIELQAEPNVLALIALAVCPLAVTLQGVSDFQMHRYRKKRLSGETDSPFIRDGLWRHSRHPNYLGEIIMWWGVGAASVLALGAHPYLLLGAFLNTLLFLFVSIPMADKRQSRKEGFAEYKSQTRILLPIAKHPRGR